MRYSTFLLGAFASLGLVHAFAAPEAVPEAWDDESAYLLSDHSVQSARDTGTLSELALALSARAPVLVFCGEFSAAASAVAGLPA